MKRIFIDLNDSVKRRKHKKKKHPQNKNPLKKYTHTENHFSFFIIIIIIYKAVTGTSNNNTAPYGYIEREMYIDNSL